MVSVSVTIYIIGSVLKNTLPFLTDNDLFIAPIHQFYIDMCHVPVGRLYRLVGLDEAFEHGGLRTASAILRPFTFCIINYTNRAIFVVSVYAFNRP